MYTFLLYKSLAVRPYISDIKINRNNFYPINSNKILHFCDQVVKYIDKNNLENQFKIVIAKDLLEIQKLNTNLILLSPGAITRTELKNLKQNINVQGISFLGALIIDLESLSFSENYLKREELLNQFRGKYQDLLNIFRN